MRYEIDGWSKFTAEDSFEHGEIPHTETIFSGKDQFVGDTAEQCIQRAVDTFWVDDVQLTAADEQGRVDMSRMERGDGEKASERDIELWKKGKLRLWNATFTVYVYAVEREPADLTDLQDSLKFG